MSMIGLKSGRPGAVPSALRSVDQPQSLLDRVSFALRVRRERQALQTLDDATLKDLGLSRTDVQREAMRGMFDLPNQDPADRRYKI